MAVFWFFVGDILSMLSTILLKIGWEQVHALLPYSSNIKSDSDVIGSDRR
jgi:hypothetical protein